MRGPLRHTTKAVAILGVAAILLAACSSSKKSNVSTGGSSATSAASGGGSKGTVKIGFFGALTGPNAQLGINEYNGTKLAVDQFNKKGGTQVDLVKYDSQGDPAQAPQLAQKAISDKVVAIVGPAFSGESKAADPIFEQAHIVNVTASATNPGLATNGWKYWHRVVGNDNAQGPSAADFISKKLAAKKVAVIDDNQEYSLGIANIVRQTLGSLVAFSDHIDPKAQDYSATVNGAKAANVDAIFYGGYYAEGGRLLQQLRDAGVTAPFVSDDGAEDNKLVSTAGAANAEGAYATCPCGDVTQSTTAGTFVQDYKADAGTDPAIYSAEAYDAASVILQAIGAGKTTGPDINTYLATIDFKGITKEIKFGDNGDIAASGIYIYKVTSGSFQVQGLVSQLIGS